MSIRFLAAVAACVTLLTFGRLAGAVVPNPDWDTVTAQLEEGGDAYLYASLDTAMDSILDRLYLLALMGAQQGGQYQAEIDQMMEVLRAVVEVTGFQELDDVGASVVTLEDGSRRARLYLQLQEVRGFFNARGDEPRVLEAMSFIPRDAVAATVQNIDTGALMQVIDEAVVVGAGQVGKTELDKQLQVLKDKSGVDLRGIATSMAGEYATWMTLGEPVLKETPNGVLRIPRVEFCFLAKTKGGSPLFDSIHHGIDRAGKVVNEQTHSGGGRMLVLSAEANEFGLRPLVVEVGDWVIFASNEKALERSLSARALGTLAASPAYQKLAAGMPAEVNSVMFISPEAKLALADLAAQVSALNPLQAQEMGPVLGIMGIAYTEGNFEPRGILSVRVNKPNGILWITQGDVDATDAFRVLLLPALPVFAAIAVPNFIEAQTRSKVARTRSDMRSMATAIETYRVDHNDYPAWSLDPALNARGSAEIPSLRTWPEGTSSYEGLHMTVTSPIAYITSLPEDIFADEKVTFGYYAIPGDKDSGSRPAWLLFSPGPDGDFDIKWEMLKPGGLPANSPWLLPMTYDPTNGTVSDGDIWRINNR
ncbi:MAG: Type secretion system protein [Candidatus Sumerlaeota bacterium]|nr:Type secretion system protein [Candidatus Sumerlaeota bacterium]